MRNKYEENSAAHNDEVAHPERPEHEMPRAFGHHRDDERRRGQAQAPEIEDRDEPAIGQQEGGRGDQARDVTEMQGQALLYIKAALSEEEPIGIVQDLKQENGKAHRQTEPVGLGMILRPHATLGENKKPDDNHAHHENEQVRGRAPLERVQIHAESARCS